MAGEGGRGRERAGEGARVGTGATGRPPFEVFTGPEVASLLDIVREVDPCRVRFSQPLERCRKKNKTREQGEKRKDLENEVDEDTRET